MAEISQKKVLVLGSSGMLGAMVTDYLSKSGLSVTATVRDPKWLSLGPKIAPEINWTELDAESCNVAEISNLLRHQDYVINAIGITKPYIKDECTYQVQRAINVNSLFPLKLKAGVEQSDTMILQIATDCVYSGSKGRYVEKDLHDPVDVYGKTKSLGEVSSTSFNHFRCSIVGPEPERGSFLWEWLLSQPQKASINGYINHDWNGITTLALAKIFMGVITEGNPTENLQHIIPSDTVTKFELLELFSKCLSRRDLSISPTHAAETIDRTLNTSHENINEKLWLDAGYAGVPSVEDLITEISKYDFRFNQIAFQSS